MSVASSQTISPEDQQTIEDLRSKIAGFHAGEIPEDKFKSFRLTRGVYGQRQLGVQMFRTKIPFGKLTADQLIRVADMSDAYATGNLHLTTRQNVQYHYVKVENTPAIWEGLAAAGVTAMGACGNTVRNFTASARAGIDPNELFDVTPYVYESFRYFLRNPICQDMGRKIKIAFSASDHDSAFTYFHDFGFIPRTKEVNGEEIRGFKVVVGGGLGAQSIVAPTAYEFLPEDQIIPFMEAGIRVFDRYGERAKRFKARMKFLVKQLGLEAWMELVEQERLTLPYKSYPIDRNVVAEPFPPVLPQVPEVQIEDTASYTNWLKYNVFEQKQAGFYGVQLRVKLGDISSDRARKLAELVKVHAADDIRITVNQGLLLRFVRPESLRYLYTELGKLDLADPGFDSLVDITACPGTETCNLAVTNSTHIATELESVVRNEYPELIGEASIKVKISGCMNSCGQHMAANIGLHGSSIKKGALVVPAMQVVIGGGVDPTGKGFVAEKVIKLPTKRIPQALRVLLEDYDDQANEGEYFNDYYYRAGKRYFYSLLKPLADTETLSESDFQDWGHAVNFIPEVGVGECAGVSYDMVGTIITDAQEKIALANDSLVAGEFANSIYHSYGALVIGAKALLLAKDVQCNTQIGILRDFDTHYGETGLTEEESFEAFVLQLKNHEPGEEFARTYGKQAATFVATVVATRRKQLLAEEGDKVVIDNYYKA